MVPKDWEHPKNDEGKFVPLLSGSFEEADQEWNDGYAHWLLGEVSDYATNGWKPVDDKYRGTRFTDYHGSRPSPEDYMPEFSDGSATHLMMYESTSEGTPISPAFATPEELARWLSDSGASSFAGYTATYEQWLATCKRGYAPSAVFTPQTGLISGVEFESKQTEK
jgi:hypothetical protein